MPDSLDESINMMHKFRKWFKIETWLAFIPLFHVCPTTFLCGKGYIFVSKLKDGDADFECKTC